jgi:hypothetical protein
MVILLVGLIALAILGTLRVGGGAELWRLAVDTSRINFNE